ncbi:hypothetical protein RchiOBHm_Chr2g0119081 [Rosa chinensis]|uniref:Uncharacterized protein n=1 Tax=Rosa chinensis TaxID=74649 RepID=A0A2P6RRX8_ROSCH|nr:hypothetical protein RchiOBHm_Chr2g0119081 [Rosa chinensis]
MWRRLCQKQEPTSTILLYSISRAPGSLLSVIVIVVLDYWCRGVRVVDLKGLKVRLRVWLLIDVGFEYFICSWTLYLQGIHRIYTNLATQTALFPNNLLRKSSPVFRNLMNFRSKVWVCFGKACC